jgi:Uma2 family endonuclease
VQAMNAVTSIRMDKETFLRWVQRQERRHELVGGRPMMVAGATRDHSAICTNIVLAVGIRLDRQTYDVSLADFAIEIGETIRYPDVVVHRRPVDGKALSTAEPLLAVE